MIFQYRDNKDNMVSVAYRENKSLKKEVWKKNFCERFKAVKSIDISPGTHVAICRLFHAIFGMSAKCIARACNQSCAACRRPSLGATGAASRSVTR